MRKSLLLFFAIVATITAMANTLTTRRVNNGNRCDIRQNTTTRVAARAADLEYTDLGTGLMTDALVTEWYQMSPVTYEVRIQQATDGSAHYRVIAPYGEAWAKAIQEANNITLTDAQYDKAGTAVLDIDATNPDDVYFPKTMINADWGDGQMYIGIPTIGKVTFADGIFMSVPRGVAVGDDTGAVALNMSGKWRIVLPGVTPTDYELKLAPESQCLTERKFTADITVGQDIDKLYYGIFPEFQEDEMLSAIGKVMTAGHEFAPRQKFSFEMNDYVTKETLVLVGVDRQGNQVAYDWATYYFINDDDANWVTIGHGDFTDPFLPALTNCESETLNVEIQAHRERTGYLRLKNPYANSSYATDRYHHGSAHNHYIYINGENPDCIYIEESPICFDFGYGLCRVNSFANYFLQAGYDLEEVMELEMGGIYEDGVLTFPEEALNFSMLGYDNGDWYYTDPDKGDFSLTLPAGYDFAGVSNITADNSADAPVEYYNLQGIRIASPQPGTLTIVRRGTTTTKVLVK